MSPALRWPLFILALLGLDVACIVALFYFAGADDSFAIEPDYYEKALRWDDARAQAAANAQLGWTLSLQLPDDAPTDLRATLTDADDAPIADASIALTLRRRARPSDSHALVLQSSEAGLYTAPRPHLEPGAWVWTAEVRAGSALFTDSGVAWITPPRSSP